ncbi:hypothetical protein [Pedobacter sandarakinus]|uniref:hypothetical protein n=1 Tax=Pedobacter sandarakinus TaxID=353156 RepID=UPI002245E992|nr:hypothetical protein [Pedobacter sandarakinus]MCX2575629.1 hypothetical protein [Pedobacter sandarakinus]
MNIFSMSILNVKHTAIRSALLCLFIVGALSQIVQAQQGFGTNNPAASSVVDMTATDKGVLLPRIALTSTALAAPVVSPANALTVFNTNTAGDVKPGYYYWNLAQAKWVSLNDEQADVRMVGGNNHITQDAGVLGNGTSAGTGSGNILFGQNSGKSTNLSNRDNNIMIGQSAGGNADTQEAILIGWNAGSKLGTSTFGLDVDPGVYIGVFAGAEQSRVIPNFGSRNVFVGSSAGRNGQNFKSVIIGSSAGSDVNGQNNILLGSDVGGSLNSDNNILIGTALTAISNTTGNQLNIGGWIYGDNGKIGIGTGTTVPSERLDIANGGIKIRDLNLPAYTANLSTDKVVMADPDGILKAISASSLIGDVSPWNVQNTSTKATLNSQNIYQNGKVAVGFSSTDAVSAKQLEVKGDILVNKVDAGVMYRFETNNDDQANIIAVADDNIVPTVSGSGGFLSVGRLVSSFSNAVDTKFGVFELSPGRAMVNYQDKATGLEASLSAKEGEAFLGTGKNYITSNEGTFVNATQTDGVQFIFGKQFNPSGVQTYKFPTNTGAANQVLTTNGTTNAQLIWKDLSAASIKSNIIKITAGYTTTADDYTILVNATTGGITLTLPTASSSLGRILVIRKTDETSNLLTFSEAIKISETTSFTTLNVNSTIRIQSDGIAWYKID